MDLRFESDTVHFISERKITSRDGAAVARWAHNPKAEGSIPSPATLEIGPVRLSVRTRDFHSLKRSSILLQAT